MWSRLLERAADEATVDRGRHHAGDGRVVDLTDDGESISATVRGASPYSVVLTRDTWYCDCPMGDAGDFCKHCVAVAIVADRSADEVTVSAPPDSDSGGTAASWLDSLTADQLRELLAKAVMTVDGMASFVSRAYAAASDDTEHVMAEVEDTFTPHRRFYDYRQANAYAVDVEPTVQLLEERAKSAPSAELLDAVERATTLAVRTIMRSDDSSGMQGMVIGRLLDVHLRVALNAELDGKRQRKLVKWLHSFMFGKQDFFFVNIDEYAPALRPSDIDAYRRLAADASTADPTKFAVWHEQGRLAILDRDEDAIVRIFGHGLENVYGYVQVVEALDEAGLHDKAVSFARRGLDETPRDWRSKDLVERLVKNATERDDTAEVVRLRADDFAARPSSTTYLAYRKVSVAAGTWEQGESGASELLAKHSTRDWIVVLRHLGRHDQAWAAAERDAASVDANMWQELCDQRRMTHPGETLPHYRRLVDDVLMTADKRNYRTAAKLLRTMREASHAAGENAAFAGYLAEVMERNNRRPTFVREATRTGLVS